MKKITTVLFALMLVLSGCLGMGDGDDIVEPVRDGLDTDNDGVPDAIDEDDDNDRWSDEDELDCNTNSLLVTDVPEDTDDDGVCNLLDSDDDGDGASDEKETFCGSDPLDASSLPADLDGDGVCDALDSDDDGDGVDDVNDFDPMDPNKSEGVLGCMDSSAFNYDALAEEDDGACFTLEDAEVAIKSAMEGVMAMKYEDYQENLVVLMIVDDASSAAQLSLTLLDEDTGAPVASIVYLSIGTGFVQIDQTSPVVDQYGQPTGESDTTNFLVDETYFDGFDDEVGWSHCEYDGAEWYCVDVYGEGWGDYEEEQLFESESEGMTLHQFHCEDGGVILINQVNDGINDCEDGSDEPMIDDQGTYTCDDGATIPFHQANNGEQDCEDGSDEDTFIVEFECGNGLETIPSRDVNDGYNDCEDGSDEPEYDIEQYETSSYTCDDGTVIPLSKVNDDTEDCVDGMDESPPGDYTELFIFSCSGSFEDNDGDEIPLSKVNDGTEDCDEGQDEVQTDESGVETSEFPCYDLMTDDMVMIYISQVNDGTVDCDVRQDEAALAGNETENWFGEDGDDGEPNGDCQMGGEDFAIPWSWVNDGTDDCDDGGDEPSYDSTGAEESFITCNDGTAIALSLANDGNDHCSEGEDETTWAMVAVFTCGDGSTIDFDWVNDGYNDCEDGSDEPVYDLEEFTEYTCDDGTVIGFSLVNNGVDDCADAEDEPVYELIEYTLFECSSGGEILLSLVNDGASDCPAGDDEPAYDPVLQTETSTYQCPWSEEIIALSLVNDGNYDCEDMLDEPDDVEMETSEFTCADGSSTFDLSWTNDGNYDCEDGSDEAQIDYGEDTSVLVCSDGSEITISQFNDGEMDCSDGSDEERWFECADGMDEIRFSYVNDGWMDCEDGSDESSAEDLNKIACDPQDEYSLIRASQFHDGQYNCENGWDEMDFEIVQDCEWEDENGWMCDNIFLSPREEWILSEEVDDSGRAMFVLSVDEDEHTSLRALFDATTHAFLRYEEVNFDDGGGIEGLDIITSSEYDSSLLNGFEVDTSLDEYAPPWAVMFDGEPMPVEDDRMFVCDDGSEIVFAAINDGVDDCADAEDEPQYEEVEWSEFYCEADDEYIGLSQVNDGTADCSDSEDEDDGTGTQTYYCYSEENEFSDGMIPFAKVNDGTPDCSDQEDEPYYDERETSEWECEDDGWSIPLSFVNDYYGDCEDGSDEAPIGEGHGYGSYDFSSKGMVGWNLGEDDMMMELVFMSCDSFEFMSSEEDYDDEVYLLPQDCGVELARYTFDEIMDGDIAGLSIYDANENNIFDEDDVVYVTEDFELSEWNTVRLSTPDGKYADKNPEVVLPAPGIAFSTIAMLGAAMVLRRRIE